MADLLRQHARTLVLIARIVETHFVIPGSPVAAIIIYLHQKGVFVSEIAVSDDASPLTARVRLLDAKGNETTPDDTPQWSSSDEEVATVQASEDGLSATVTIVGKVGATLIAVESLEGDTGDWIRAQGTVTVNASTTAVSGEVTFEQ